MKADFAVSVIVPVYNNAAILAETIRQLTSYLAREFTRYELIFVDDASIDESWSLLKLAAGENPNIRLLRHSINLGQQWASARGAFAAQEAILISVDCDLPCKLEDLKKLAIAASNGIELVLGRRIGGRPRIWWREVGSACVAVLTSLLYSYRIQDFGCSTGAARREVIDRLRGKTPKVIKIQLLEEAHSFAEIEIDASQEIKRTESGYTFRALFRLFWTIIWYKIAR
ncbi:glycosyltransferase family 2 protein [Turneriella parva]|uniref:Glycosyl transferase family 2 n=1 Tax=Turneriella parva (strain ATCC BAA-1111 / DSM 21527 / NCTC 11395 / H) TaxID=869212 RepID=I4B4Q6_TURPD|nr:glycosyltransferase family 2 protein [Turneriella parva]AFM12263.1 glycosyl transferase family 2 [Turneriella parva DSM 21527]